MKKKRLSEKGFSVTELLILVVVSAIVTTIAVMQLGGSKTDLQRQRIAREFKVYLERARFDSVKRRAVNASDMSSVVLNSSSSFTANLDLNEDGKLDSGESRTVDFALRSDAQIVVSDASFIDLYPITIRFNQRGRITATNRLGDAVNPVFTICSENCSESSPDSSDLTVISVSSTGTVATLKNGQNPSFLPTPSVTNTSPQLNCYVLLLNSNSNSATCSSY